MYRLQKWFRLSVLKGLLILLLISWAVTSTVYAIRNQPKIILIALEDNRTRLITSGEDPLLEAERLKFVKEVLYLYYNYSSTNYTDQMNKAGAYMSDTQWDSLKLELSRIETQLKTERLTQEANLSDVRVISATEFEADLDITIRHRLTDKRVKYRVTLKLSPRKRSTTNPYAWEVATLVENEIR